MHVRQMKKGPGLQPQTLQNPTALQRKWKFSDELY